MLVLNPSVLYAQAEPKFSRLSLLEASSVDEGLPERPYLLG